MQAAGSEASRASTNLSDVSDPRGDSGPGPSRVVPTFEPASADSPIRKVVFPILAFDWRGECTASGTCVVIGSRLALTARHVVEDWVTTHEGVRPSEGRVYDRKFEAFAVQSLDSGKSMALWRVMRIWGSGATDAAFLELVPANDRAAAQDAEEWLLVPLDLAPPAPGERVVAFGYHTTSASFTEANDTQARITWVMDDATTAGEVTEVFDHGRPMTPWPCFQTNLQTRGSMSGGPVFTDDGHVCGLVCSGLNEGEEATDHVSWMASLWPTVATVIDAPRPGRVGGGPYTVLEAIEERLISARNADRVTVVRDEESGQTHIALRPAK